MISVTVIVYASIRYTNRNQSATSDGISNNRSEPSILTKENYRKVHEGMNNDDVKRILGEPTEKKTGQLYGGEIGQIWGWKEEDRRIVVFFDYNPYKSKSELEVIKKREVGIESREADLGSIDH